MKPRLLIHYIDFFCPAQFFGRLTALILCFISSVGKSTHKFIILIYRNLAISFLKYLKMTVLL